MTFGDDKLPTRFWQKVSVEPETQCWLWTAGCNRKGYASMYWEGRSHLSHRVAYRQLVGAIPPGKELDHLCRTRNCVNPDHLEPVKHRTNILRGNGPAAVCARKTECPAGHLYTDKNTRVYRNKRYCRACERERSRRRRGERK